MRVGGSGDIRSDFRVVAASHRDLAADMGFSMGAISAQLRGMVEGIVPTRLRDGDRAWEAPPVGVARAYPEELAGTSVTAFADAAVQAGLQIEDFGDRFRVSVAGRTREYRDADRNCPHRARLAARRADGARAFDATRRDPCGAALVL